MNKGFYKNASTMSPFQFDKIYPNKKTMDKECTDDGILIGRYVLIEYNDEDSEEYANNSAADGGKNYDSTIWQKIYDKENNIEKYVQIASVDTPRPNVAVASISPQEEPKVSVDYTTSSETYKFELPKAWGFEAKKAETEYSDEIDEDGNKLNIYYNKNAFNNINLKKIDSFETYAPNEYYYISYEDEMYQNNAITKNDVAYIIEQPVETSNDIGPDKVFNGKDYYKVKFLGDNQYLWTNIKDSEEQLYTYGETGHFILFLEDFEQIDENKFKDYSFIKIENNIFETCNYQDKNAVQEDWKKGATIFYLTYEKADKNQYNNNTKYYKLDDNSEEYYEILIIEQSTETPYWEKFSSSSSYYSLTEGEHLKKDKNASPKENTQYYKQDDNGPEEFEFEGVMKKYSPVTFGTWEPYKYYSEFEKNTNNLDLNKLLYEIKNDKIYYLSPETERGQSIYYEKIPCLKNTKINNKISLENNIDNEIKELSLILPGLGNTIAEVYDLLYKDHENRNSILYSNIEENQNMYDDDGNPLYNDNEKSVVGLMNKVYDLIGHMKVIDFPVLNEGENLSNDTIIISGTDNDNITLGSYNDLSKTLFKKADGKHYLIIKYKDNENNDAYEEKEFNEKSLYYLIAEMEHLVSGSYESIFDALNKKLAFNKEIDPYISIKQDIENKLQYTINHNEYNRLENDYVTKSIGVSNEQITVEEYILDKAGHVTTTSIAPITYYMPAAYNNKTIPKTIDNKINISVIPNGSIWYDTSILLDTPEIELINQLDTPEIELINQLDTPEIKIEEE